MHSRIAGHLSSVLAGFRPDARPLGASYRDPSGLVFVLDRTLNRQVNERYGAEYGRLMQSGLYGCLVAAGDLVPHAEVDLTPAPASRDLRRQDNRTLNAAYVLPPEAIPVISYPYEWSFSHSKDAALPRHAPTFSTATRASVRAGLPRTVSESRAQRPFASPSASST
jgi:hypothetical protein